MQLGNRNAAIDLSHYENEPERNTNKSKGFHFTYPDIVVDYDKDIYESALATSDDIVFNPKKVEDDITPFLFEAFPLANTEKNLLTAPFLFQNEETFISLIGYDFITATSHEIADYFMVELIELYKEYIRVALENVSFIEELTVLSDDLAKLTEDSTIYMYNMYHLLDEAQITTVNDKVSTVVLELKSL